MNDDLIATLALEALTEIAEYAEMARDIVDHGDLLTALEHIAQAARAAIAKATGA